jgi:uncharacterized damage-inducible protein DinB
MSRGSDNNKDLNTDFTKIIKSSFPSIHETWIHIIWAEELWYERWNGRTVCSR